MKTLALYSHTLLNPADLPLVVERAFAVLLSGRPGPVHIEIPTDVMAKPIETGVFPPVVATRPRADAETLQRAAILCTNASRPRHPRRRQRPSRLKTKSARSPSVSARPWSRPSMPAACFAGHPLHACPPAPASRPCAACFRMPISSSPSARIRPDGYDINVDGGFPRLRR